MSARGNVEDSDRLLSTRETAERLGVTVKAIQKWRMDKTGPAYIKISHSLCRYRIEDVDAWVLARRVEQ